MYLNTKRMENIAQKGREVFLQYDGVLGVGYGMKWIKQKETNVPAIVVFVEKKLPPKEVKRGELIPKKFSGFDTDVEEVRFDKEKDAADGTELYEGQPIAEFLDWGKIHQLNLRQKKQEGKNPKSPKGKRGGTNKKPPADLNTPVTEVRENLFIIEDDGTLVYTTAGGVAVVDFVGAWNLFRAEFGDDYEFAAFFLDNTDVTFPYMGNFSSTIFRDVADNGYGASAHNERATWGGSGSLLRMACHSWYTLRTMLHEIGHQWLFYVNYRNTAGGAEQTLLHESWDATWKASQKMKHPGRWADNDRSCMDYDHDDWIEISPGVYRPIGVGDANHDFCPLDQYLMGFLHPEAVASSEDNPPTYPGAGGDFQIINSPTSRPDGDYDAIPINITPQNIVWNEGARTPDHLHSQRVFHQAVIAITFDRTTSAAFLADSETRRQNHAINWRRATSGRSLVDTSLLRDNFMDVYVRDNTSDAGGTFPGGAFWDSPDIFVRNSDDDPNLYLDPTIPNDTIHQDPRSDQDNWVYARIHNKSGTDYEDVIVNFYIANYHGFSGRDTVAEAVPRTEVIYPIDWHPDSLIGSASLDSVPAGGTAVAKVQWNQTDIPATDWHPCILVDIIPMGTSPTELHHVWDNKKLGQKNIDIEYIPADDYEFDFPFVIGHAISPSRFGFLELEREIDLPSFRLYVDPGTSLGELQEVAGVLFHKIPGLEKLKAEEISKIATAFPDTTEKEGLIVSIPQHTSLSISCGKCITKPEKSIQVTFCDDTRLLIQPEGVDYRHMGFLPLEGFVIESLAGKNVLRMENPHKATFPFPLAQIKEHEMKLKVSLDGKKLERTVKLHITQRDEAGRVIGGIDLQLRPKR